MNVTRTLLTALFVTAALTASPTEPHTVTEPELLPYEELHAEPVQHLGETIRFAFSFESELKSWNPYLTRFGPSDFSCARGWSDESFPWLASEFANPSIRIFVPRGSDVELAIDSASPYSRFEVEGTLRELFAGQLWIEVTALTKLEAKLNEGTVIHAERAVREMEAEQFTLDIENLERARVGILPAPSAAELERLLNECRAALNGER